MDDLIPKEARGRIDQIGKADLVVGILARDRSQAGATLAMVRDAVATFASVPRTVMVQNDGVQPSGDDIPVLTLSDSPLESDPVARIQTVQEGYQSIFAMSEKLQVRACCVLASGLPSSGARWISLLAQPVLEMGFDLVAPCYSFHKFDGLLNRGIISPLYRAMYGKRIENPMGPDLGFSARTLERMLGSDRGKTTAAEPSRPLASVTSAAINAGFSICQANVGSREYLPADSTDVSSLLAEILGPLFVDLERNAAFWQRTRGSNPVPDFGETTAISEESRSVDVHRIVESFQLGVRNLNEIWGLVLPPSTLLELKKMSRLTQEQFRMPDALWARIVYDFALAHRLRTISRDHLLRAMTPLYLGWVASHTLELESAEPTAVEERIERLCLAYETEKPYFVSRWRWPDRFNP